MPGIAGCIYAKAMNGRAGWNGNVVRQPGQIEKVLKRRKPTKFFWGSMTDIFHEKVLFEWIDEVMAAIAMTPWHTHQILTKRPERELEYFTGIEALEPESERDMLIWDGWRGVYGSRLNEKPLWPLANLQIGISCSTQADLDRMVPIAMQIPASVRFISFEPLLGEIEASKYLLPQFRHITGLYKGTAPPHIKPNWAIVGSESGPKRRPCKLEWIHSIVEQCKSANVPVFVKQMEINGKVSHKPEEWPEWAQVQEYPK